jgi:hypothetical protein
VLKIQVTTPPIEQLLQDLGTKGHGSETYKQFSNAADTIRNAIQKKVKSNQEDVVLALDATVAPAAALPAVVNRFKELQGKWARQQGFQSIWVVGANEGLTHQLA